MCALSWRVLGTDFGVCARRAASRAGLGFTFERRGAVLGSSEFDLGFILDDFLVFFLKLFWD